jgi:ribosomal protein S12 methylthiotransferase
MNIGLLTLGCDKNTVDNEYLAGQLVALGAEVCFIEDIESMPPLDAVVVTTCGFIEDAKRQSVEALVQLTDRKRETGFPRRVVAAGCLSQRYPEELRHELPGLDGLVGVGQFDELAELLMDHRNACYQVHRKPSVTVPRYLRRTRSDAKPYAYLKISDGCNHACSFCSVPLMKGRLRSVAPDILEREARDLLDGGARELVLIAQDLTAYGRDLSGRLRLPGLLRRLAAIEGDFWLRCLYAHPSGVSGDFLEVLATEPKVVAYLDIPFQHLDTEMLRLMKRPALRGHPMRLVETIRVAVPGIALRTTMIAGFPGETPAIHRRMLDGMRQLRFDWLGAFPYSPEEDTAAAGLPRPVRPATRQRRWEAVMETQAAITFARNREQIGSRCRVLVEKYDEERGQWRGRTPYQAPDVDGCVYLEGDAPLRPGLFVEAEIIAAEHYDLTARIL